MKEELSEFNPVDEAAEEFVERYRRGERPSLTEYVRKYPAVADKIRALFPALVAMEELGKVETLPHQRPDPEGGIPRQLGDYQIIREIARGGMGIVYEAVQQSLGRHVALKVLALEGRTHPNHLERFQAEARAAARLHHTNIVPVFDVGEHNGVHYFAMQYIQGQSLDSVLQEVKRLRNKEKPSAAPTPGLVTEVAGNLLTGRFRQPDQPTEEAPAGTGGAEQGTPGEPAPGAPPPPGGSTSSLLSRPAGSYYQSVAQVGLQVAEALEYAHQQRILHRDIKPSNLMLDTRGTVWVMDFGLAKAEGEEDLTRAGDIVGTIRYMAPERFHGKADVRSDVYSLGLTLFEMVALRPAFASEERAQLVEGILHHEPPPLRKLDPRVPRDLETIILKAGAREPAGRYPSAAEMAEDLRRFLADRPVRARRARVVERTWRWCRRNPLVATLTGAVAALLVTVAVVASLMAWNLRKEELATRGQLKLTREAQHEGRVRLFHTLVEQARASRLSGRMGRRFQGLAILDEAAKIARELKLPDKDFLELRNETIACLALLDLRIDREGPGLPASSNSVHCDRAFEVYARGDTSGDISVRRVAGDVEIHRFPSGLRFPGVRLSPDGHYLLAWDLWGRHLKVWRLGGPEPEVVVDEPSEPVYAFSPAGRQMALGYPDGAIHLVDLPSGRRRQWRVAPSFVFLTYHPTKPRLAVAYRQKVEILDVGTGTSVGSVPVRDLDQWVAWHPDGRTLATAGTDRNIYLWDTASGTQVARLEGQKNSGVRMAFNPSGSLLASESWDATLRLWDPRTGRQLFVTQTDWGHHFHFSPDGRLLGPGVDLAGGILRLWGVAEPCGYRTLVRDAVWGRENYKEFGISPGGRLLAVGMPDGLALGDLAARGPLQFLPIGKGESLLVERSGDLLVSRPDGVFRFTIRPDPSTSGSLRIGAGEKLPLPGPAGGLARSRDDRVVAVARYWRGALVWNRDLPGPPIPLSHEDVRYVAVSPDGRWVATGSHGSSLETRVWEAKSGRLVKRLPGGGGLNMVGFSPDGRWLATKGDGVRLWKVPSWEEGPRIGGGVFAFSEDGKILAVESGSGSLRLVDPATGGEFARLEDPEQDRAFWLRFSPDGSQLVANGEFHSLHVWDLRAIGGQLAQRNLEWNLPLPAPGERRDATPPGPLKVSVEPSVRSMTDLPSRAGLESRQGRWDKALWLYLLAIEWDPKNARGHNGLAWIRATCPDARYRDAARAVEAAKKAVALAPQDGNVWNTLGVAEYRAGDWKAAVGALSRSVRLRQGQEPRDFFFLGMAIWKRGDKELARKWYALGAHWMDLHPAADRELLRFRTEAAELLGMFRPPGTPAEKDPMAYYTLLKELVPDATWAYRARALACCARGRWNEAAADFAELLKAGTEGPVPWCEYASVLLLKGDREGYRRVCESVVKRFGGREDAIEQYMVARTLSLAPNEVFGPGQAIRRAEKALAAYPDWPWFRHSLAVAHYRAGQFGRALKEAEKSLEVSPRWVGHVVNYLLLAMIHEKLGHHQDARRWLEKSLKWLEEAHRREARETPFSLPLPSWCDQLEAELLRREARALIRP